MEYTKPMTEDEESLILRGQQGVLFTLDKNF